jgi:hypothetical protein
MAQQIASYLKEMSPEQSLGVLRNMLSKMEEEVQELPDKSEAVTSLFADALTVISVSKIAERGA